MRPRAAQIAAVVLAAGRSTRMEPANKLLIEIDGKPMIRRVAEAALGSGADPVVVVTGHESEKIGAALAGLAVTRLYNPDYAAGISTSLRHGLAALSNQVDGAIIILGDMPRVSVHDIDRLIAAFHPLEGRAICLPTWQGKRGNPVLFARRFFPEMQGVSGDIGARALISAYPDLVHEVPMPDDAVLVDFDTQASLDALDAEGH